MSSALQQGSVRAALRPRGTVLLVAPPGPDTDAMTDHLGRMGHTVVSADEPEAAIARSELEDFDLAVVDSSLASSLSHVSLASNAVLLAPVGTEVGEAASPSRYLAALRHPLSPDAVRAIVELAVLANRLERRCASLERSLEGLRDGSAMIGRSPISRRLATVLRRAADSVATVLLEGPAGAGKTLAAHIIHQKGRRCDRDVVALPSATVDETTMSAALVEARGTTLLIEDVDQLPPAAQSVLVRHLKELPRPGAGQDQAPRIVATSSARLPELIARGLFREDLYYRLNVFPVVVQALRERREDVPLLAHYFQENEARKMNTTPGGFTPSAMILLESHPWPGNVAQLETVIQRAVALAAGGVVDRVHVLGPGTGLTQETIPHVEAAPVDDDEVVTEASIRPLEEEEQRLLSRALCATKGNVRRAAQLLGIGRATLYRKIQVYKLKLN